jgi:hypothetical protein
MSDRNYSESGWPDWTPAVSYVTAGEAARKARRSFWRGIVIGGLLTGGAFIGSAAFGETIHIGRLHVNGTEATATTITLEPSSVPGEMAVVTLDNRLVNDGRDTGTYFLSIEGLTVEIDFTWDSDPLLGSDRIVVYPPDGIICLPEDCGVTVVEGFTGTVTLFDWRGM